MAERLKTIDLQEFRKGIRIEEFLETGLDPAAHARHPLSDADREKIRRYLRGDVPLTQGALADIRGVLQKMPRTREQLVEDNGNGR